MLLLLTFTAQAKIDCNKHPIYCKIKKLKPNMSYNKAMKLSNLFYKYSKKYKTNPIISVAIAMQETGLNTKLHRKESIIVFDSNNNWKYIKGYSDICMFQFHATTIVNNKLNPIKLRDSIDYCIYNHFKLLSNKIKLCRKLKIEKPWSCYHSITPKFRNKYIKDVSRFL